LDALRFLVTLCVGGGYKKRTTTRRVTSLRSLRRVGMQISSSESRWDMMRHLQLEI